MRENIIQANGELNFDFYQQKNQKEIEKILMNFFLELTILIIHLHNFQKNLTKNNLISVVSSFSENLTSLINFFNEKGSPKSSNINNDYNLTYNEIINLIKLSCMIINQASYYNIFQEDILNTDVFYLIIISIYLNNMIILKFLNNNYKKNEINLFCSKFHENK